MVCARVARWGVWAWELWLTYVACILGVCLSGYGWMKLLWGTTKAPSKSVSFPGLRIAKISVIIPCYNEKRSIYRTLRWLDEVTVVRSLLQSTRSLD
jgi:cellulose synthase/poly-beta-1,6-N-acetylglucosamine synthase-like glycosyltransferase